MMRLTYRQTISRGKLMMKTNNIIYRLAAPAALATALCLTAACSKEPPPPQPPVVINLNNPAALTQSQPPVPAPAPAAAQNAAPAQTPAAGSSNMSSLPSTAEAHAQGRHAPEQEKTPCFDIENMDEASFFNMQIHEMALQLLKNFRSEPGPDGPVAVATFVDLNHLYRTTPFGRYLAEQLMGELQRAGFNVVEIRKTESIMIKQKFGEYGLSRDVQEIAQESSASYILAGTYVTRGRYILINARLISNENNLVTSSGLKILRRDPFLNKMLWPSASPGTGPAVRIPIKELGQLTNVQILSES